MRITNCKEGLLPWNRTTDFTVMYYEPDLSTGQTLLTAFISPEEMYFHLHLLAELIKLEMQQTRFHMLNKNVRLGNIYFTLSMFRPIRLWQNINFKF